ncbi:MAG: PilZ domain-containing protein [Proteobacteria bacterium]|nr:PilZ domain-containing protein [Pseudomonadota bacterium]MBU1736688.1 PilZ domain-containing protein [Pseudomonadota bacterium]
MMDERREGIRVELDVTVSEKLVSGTAKARAINLSRTGMRYIKPVNYGRHGSQEVFLEFTLSGESAPIQVTGWVVEEVAREDLLETAVTFMFLPEGDEKKINAYVQKHLQSREC